MNTERQRIFDMLMKEALKPDVGRDVVQGACELFLKLRTTNKSTPREKVPRSWTMGLWRKQNGICARCRNSQPVPVAEASFDHIVPLDQGGEHNKKNGRMVHKRCNSSKGANDLVTESKKTGDMISDMYPVFFSKEEQEEREVQAGKKSWPKPGDPDFVSDNPDDWAERASKGLVAPDDPKWDTVIYPPEE